MFEYRTMREIGKRFGLTSHAVGRRLKELGLRNHDGKPSARAFDECYCAQRWTDDGEHYYWAWDERKTIAALESGGLRRLDGA